MSTFPTFANPVPVEGFDIEHGRVRALDNALGTLVGPNANSGELGLVGMARGAMDFPAAIVFRGEQIPRHAKQLQYAKSVDLRTPRDETLQEFMSIRTSDQALAFANRWGLLGILGPIGQFLVGDGDDAVRCFGEPVSVYLFHAERLRAWKDFLHFVRRYDGLKSSERKRARKRFLAYLRWSNSNDRMPWRYTVDKDIDFTELEVETDNLARRCIELSRRTTRRTATCEELFGWWATHLTQVASRAVSGHIRLEVHPNQRIGVPTAESLIAWLYMAFYELHIVEFKLRETAGQLVICRFCGKATYEDPRIVGRKQFCGQNCRKKWYRAHPKSIE